MPGTPCFQIHSAWRSSIIVINSVSERPWSLSRHLCLRSVHGRCTETMTFRTFLFHLCIHCDCVPIVGAHLSNSSDQALSKTMEVKSWCPGHCLHWVGKSVDEAARLRGLANQEILPSQFNQKQDVSTCKVLCWKSVNEFCNFCICKCSRRPRLWQGHL